MVKMCMFIIMNKLSALIGTCIRLSESGIKYHTKRWILHKLPVTQSSRLGWCQPIFPKISQLHIYINVCILNDQQQQQQQTLSS